jgi:hypothetical protein
MTAVQSIPLAAEASRALPHSDERVLQDLGDEVPVVASTDQAHREPR